MASMPRFILRDCAILVNRRDKIGDSSEIVLPAPKEKLEELRNSGMVMPIEIMMGYEKLEFSFKLTAFDPQSIVQFGLRVGVEREFMATGALVHENGAVNNATAFLKGRLNSFDPGSWKTGEIGENNFSVSGRYYRLEVGGRELIEMSPFEVKIDGISQTNRIREALLA